MVQRPVRRAYSERPEERGRLRDVDLPRRARFLHAFGWLALAGLVWGGLVGSLVGGVGGGLLGMFAGILLLGVVGGGILLLITERVGGLARVLYSPSGSSTPRRPDHSYAKSLVARGDYLRATEAYEEALARDPSDPFPYMALSRIFRNELGDFHRAARWLRRARRDADMDRGQRILVAKQLVELYRNDLGEPRKAAPELARLAEIFPDTPDGEWAARELRELKDTMAQETFNEKEEP